MKFTIKIYHRFSGAWLQSKFPGQCLRGMTNLHLKTTRMVVGI